MIAVIAACHMATERRCAAALDSTHHLELTEADMTGIGSSPSGPVVAENIRDLQLWTGHRCGGLRRLEFPLLRFDMAFWLGQTIKWAFDLGNHAGGDLCIARGHIQFAVSEHRLNYTDIDTAL